MVINRRQFLSAMGLAAFAPSYAQGEEAAAPPSPVDELLFAASRKHKNGSFQAALFDLEGDQAVISLPGRGHDFAVRPRKHKHLPRELVVFARRPGNFAVAFGENKAKAPIRFVAKAGRHFYGHGLFSPNGRLLYSTENDYDKGRGVLGVRDAAKAYQQIGELPTYGVGPHDMALLSDGRTMVIANGGIETHPRMGRAQLNIGEMKPSLVFVDRVNGELLERHSLPLAYHQLSIRHLTVGANDQVFFGCQYKGSQSDQLALMGHCKRGGKIELMSAPSDVQQQMKQYIGSVKADSTGQIIAASCPKGNMVSFWSAEKQAFLGARPLSDGCGLAQGAKAGEFLMTSGKGVVALSNQAGVMAQNHQKKIMWDNHAVSLR